MPELKPCPFCGGKAKFIHLSSTSPYSIRCAETKGWCETIPQTRNYPTVADAIEAWNKRVGE